MVASLLNIPDRAFLVDHSHTFGCLLHVPNETGLRVLNVVDRGSTRLLLLRLLLYIFNVAHGGRLSNVGYRLLLLLNVVVALLSRDKSDLFDILLRLVAHLSRNELTPWRCLAHWFLRHGLSLGRGCGHFRDFGLGLSDDLCGLGLGMSYNLWWFGLRLRNDDLGCFNDRLSHNFGRFGFRLLNNFDRFGLGRLDFHGSSWRGSYNLGRFEPRLLIDLRGSDRRWRDYFRKLCFRLDNLWWLYFDLHRCGSDHFWWIALDFYLRWLSLDHHFRWLNLRLHNFDLCGRSNLDCLRLGLLNDNLGRLQFGHDYLWSFQSYLDRSGWRYDLRLCRLRGCWRLLSGCWRRSYLFRFDRRRLVNLRWWGHRVLIDFSRCGCRSIIIFREFTETRRSIYLNQSRIAIFQ